MGDGQGLEDIEAELSNQKKALQAIRTEKQELAKAFADKDSLKPVELEIIRKRYEELLLQENNILKRIHELNDRSITTSKF